MRITVVAADAVDAEVLATSLFLAGVDAAAAAADAAGVPAVIVGADGRDAARRRARVKTDPTFWLLARASGLTAYVLLTTTALAGLVLKSRPFGER